MNLSLEAPIWNNILSNAIYAFSSENVLLGLKLLTKEDLEISAFCAV